MKKDNVIRGINLVTFVGALIVFIYFTITYPSSLEEYKVIEIKDEVKIKCNEGAEEIVKFSDYTLPTSNEGDTYIIKYIMPDEYIKNPSLIMDLYHSVIEIYVDEEKIYEYGEDLYKNNTPLGHEYFNIPLPSNFAGRELMIKIMFTEKDSLFNIPTIRISNERINDINLIEKNILVILVSMALILFGIIGLIFSLTRKYYGKECSNISLIAFFCIDISIWMMTSTNMASLFIKNFQIVSFLEYFSLYVASIPVLFYFSRMQSQKKHSALLRNYSLICTIALIATLLSYILFEYNYTNILSLFHLFMCVGVILILYCSIRAFKEKKRSEKVLICGMLFMGVVIFLDILRFNIDKYVEHNFFLGISLMPIGATCFIFGMLYSYGVDIITSYYDSKEKELLKKLVYKDPLTGIYNRRKCEEIMIQVDKEKEDVAIVNYDINNLKFVNDNLGHQMGDDMIIKFSHYLSLAYDGIGEVGRMGGDEFIVIIKGKSEYEVILAINKLEGLLKNFNNNRENRYKLTSAVGYALRHGEEISVWKLYEIADKRMYECKKKA